MLPGQIFPGQMSPLQLKSVQGCPRNLSLKFGQNLASNSLDIADIEFLVVLLRVAGWPGGWPGGRVGGWLDQMEIRLTSASVEVEVELRLSLAIQPLNKDYLKREDNLKNEDRVQFQS